MPIHVIFHDTLFKFRSNSSCCECGLLRRAYDWLNRKINVKIKCSQSNKQDEKSWYRCWPLVTLHSIISDSAFFLFISLLLYEMLNFITFPYDSDLCLPFDHMLCEFFLCFAYVSCIEFNSCFNFRFEWVNKKWIPMARRKRKKSDRSIMSHFCIFDYALDFFHRLPTPKRRNKINDFLIGQY